MSDSPSQPIPRFAWNNTEWKKQFCQNCDFLVMLDKTKPTDPETAECREGPPIIFTMPTLNALKQPALQIVTSYPRIAGKFPACSKFKEKINTAN